MKLLVPLYIPNIGKMLIVSVLIAGLAVVGCGGSSTRSSSVPAASSSIHSQGSSPTSTPANTSASPAQTSSSGSESSPSLTIEVSIPGLLPEHQIASRYTCDGGDLSLPVQWNSLPHGTAELAIFVLNARPVNGKLFFDWAVAGLSPSSHAIAAGMLPSGAVVGLNTLGKVGYSICPAKSTHEVYIVRLLALPYSLKAQPGFNAETLYQQAQRLAKFVGLAGGTYERR
jgi:phosphatidylethanolamine-binding protein (PEBP) family uncharacterized protein